MRRKEKEICDRGAIDAIISRSQVCRLGMVYDQQPYVVPLCFGYDNNTLYFHSAREGKKIDILKKNTAVCFEFDLDHFILKSDNACGWGMKYCSVIGYGSASFINDPVSKQKALDIIMRHYSEHGHEYAENALENIVIIKVEIESMTGKESGNGILTSVRNS